MHKASVSDVGGPTLQPSAAWYEPGAGKSYGEAATPTRVAVATRTSSKGVSGKGARGIQANALTLAAQLDHTQRVGDEIG
jgi:hypothetical protein